MFLTLFPRECYVIYSFSAWSSIPEATFLSIKMAWRDTERTLKISPNSFWLTEFPSGESICTTTVFAFAGCFLMCAGVLNSWIWDERCAGFRIFIMKTNEQSRIARRPIDVNLQRLLIFFKSFPIVHIKPIKYVLFFSLLHEHRC